MKSRTIRPRYTVAIAATALLLALTGCSAATGSTSTSSPAASSSSPKLAHSCNCWADVKVNASARDLLPASVKSSDVLNVGFNAPAPPFWYISTTGGTTYSGVEYDMIQAIGKSLGLKVQLTNQAWDGLMPALIAGRYDTIISNIGDRPERRTNINFVDYGKTGSGLLVLAANKGKYTDQSAMCGTTVGAQTGSAQVQILADISTKVCSADKTITVKALSDLKGLFPALISGQVDSIALDSASVDYWATLKQAGTPKYATVLPDLQTFVNYGIGVNNKDPKLTEAIQAAVAGLSKSGVYQKIWNAGGIGDLTIPKITVNGASTL